MSPAGTSVSGPMWRNNSLMKLVAEAHDLVVGLALGLKSSRPWSRHGQRRERVLENLLERKETSGLLR